MENTMKIKTKLAISFCIIIFVPVVLTSIVLVGFNKIQLKNKINHQKNNQILMIIMKKKKKNGENLQNNKLKK
jgi:CHASE3 domain sensor protein